MIEALYNQYFHDVFLYLKAITRSDDLAEELTQETFFKAMQALDTFKGGCDVRVWLCQAPNTGSISSFIRDAVTIYRRRLPSSQILCGGSAPTPLLRDCI